MEPSVSQNFVKDLDLTLQPRIALRYKTWLPLATQQVSHEWKMYIVTLSMGEHSSMIIFLYFVWCNF